MKPTLFLLAAGMGSRYGGLKQLDGLGPNGETIMDYSIYDAIQAGFGKIVNMRGRCLVSSASRHSTHCPRASAYLRVARNLGVPTTLCSWVRASSRSLSALSTAMTSTIAMPSW